jgi:hypothetical protein
MHQTKIKTWLKFNPIALTAEVKIQMKRTQMVGKYTHSFPLERRGVKLFLRLVGPIQVLPHGVSHPISCLPANGGGGGWGFGGCVCGLELVVFI